MRSIRRCNTHYIAWSFDDILKIEFFVIYVHLQQVVVHHIIIVQIEVWTKFVFQIRLYSILNIHMCHNNECMELLFEDLYMLINNSLLVGYCGQFIKQTYNLKVKSIVKDNNIKSLHAALSLEY